jgi:hypothetical protein
MPGARQVHQLCTAVLLRHRGDLVLVRERARLFYAPGAVKVNRLTLNAPGGGIRERDMSFDSFRYAASREGLEEIGMPDLDRLANIDFQGVYATYRSELKEQPLIMYLIWRADLPEGMPYAPLAGEEIEEVVYANPGNIQDLLKATPWRMSFLRQVWNDFWERHIRAEPYLEVNQPVHRHPLVVHQAAD